MIELKKLSAPVDDIYATQANVIAFWEAQNLGLGTLYLTAHTVTWMDGNSDGFILTYPSIAVHAASGATEQFPDPSLFLLVDIAKTDFVIHAVAAEDDEDEVKTASIRLVPQDSGSISHLYQTMNTCQELNPDPKDELDSTDEEEDDDDDQVYQPVNGGGDAQWFTAENINDGFELNDEGMANLARMMGNSENNTNSNGQNANGDGHGHDEPMDDA